MAKLLGWFGAGLLVVALLVSLYGNWRLWQRLRGVQQWLDQVLLDPHGVEAYPVGSPGALGQVRVVMLGDSRATAWPQPLMELPSGLSSGMSSGLPSRLSPRSLALPLDWVNRGINGQTSAQVLGRFGVQIAPLRPRVIVLQAGVNDLTRIAVFPQQRSQIIRRTQQHLRELVAAGQATGAQMIVTTIFPLGRKVPRGLGPSALEIQEAIAEVNTHLRRLAQEEVMVIETEPLLGDGMGWVRPHYSADWLHLNPAGYTQLNRALSPALLPLIQGEDGGQKAADED